MNALAWINKRDLAAMIFQVCRNALGVLAGLSAAKKGPGMLWARVTMSAKSTNLDTKVGHLVTQKSDLRDLVNAGGGRVDAGRLGGLRVPLLVLELLLELAAPGSLLHPKRLEDLPSEPP